MQKTNLVLAGQTNEFGILEEKPLRRESNLRASGYILRLP